MVGIADEHDSALKLIASAYGALRAKEPEHELLGLVSISEDGQTFDFKSGFNERFRREGDKFVVHSYVRYYQALQAAA